MEEENSSAAGASRSPAEENEELREQVASLRAAETKSRAQASKLREEMSALKQKAKQLEERLHEERSAASDRKRKIKSYVESLDVEKARLEKDIVEMRTRVEASDAAAKSAEEMRAEETARKDAEIAKLRREVAEATDRVASMKGACDELATHKTKRLTAKSEMVALARVLEAERDRAATAERRLRDISIPRAIEHASTLRECLSRLDDLTAKHRKDASPRTRTRSALSHDYSSPLHEDNVTTTTTTNGAPSENKAEPRRNSRTDGTPTSSKDAVADALGRLDLESEHLSAGLSLLAMSLDVLDDTLAATRTCPKPFSDCMDLLWGGSRAAATTIRGRGASSPRNGGDASYAKIDYASDPHPDDDVL